MALDQAAGEEGGTKGIRKGNPVPPFALLAFTWNHVFLPKSPKDGSHLEEWETSQGSTDGSFADQISVVWVQKGRTPSRPAGAAAEGVLGNPVSSYA
jgi:hypothetical protein